MAIDGGYAVVVSKATDSDTTWKPVVDALVVKYQASVLMYDRAVNECLAGLRRKSPRYVCFVAKPSEATREFVTEVNRLTRRMSDAPYTGAVWGILTGCDAACAVRIARHKEPLVILAWPRVRGGIADVRRGPVVLRVEPGEDGPQGIGRETESRMPGPADTTKALVEALNVYQPQLFVHLRPCHRAGLADRLSLPQRAVPLPCRGAFRAGHAGRAVPHRQRQSQGLPSGGQLPDGPHRRPDAMALAVWTVPGVYPNGGLHGADLVRLRRLGLLDYFVEQPGRFTWRRRSSPIRPDRSPGDLLSRLGKGQDRTGPPAGRHGLPRQAQKAGLTWADARGLLCIVTAWASTATRPGTPAWPLDRSPGNRR